MEKKLSNISTMNTWWQKTVGVIGKKSWGKEGGLFFPGVNSIHTFFVTLNLDLVFVDKDMVVLKLVENLKPWHISPLVWQAKGVFEFPTGTVRKKGLKVGNKLTLV